jgi:tetratricopeptide (TPR) repeat protein
VIGTAERGVWWWHARWERRLEHAEALVAEGAGPEAVAYLESLDASYPAPDCHYLRCSGRIRLLRALASGYQAEGRKGATLRTLRRAIALDPKDVTHYTRFAEAAIAFDEAGAAESALREALAIYPAHTQSVELLSELLYDDARYAEIVRLYRDYLDAMAYFRLQGTIGSRSISAPVRASGAPEALELPLALPAEFSGEIELGSEAPFRIERLEVEPARFVGESPGRAVVVAGWGDSALDAKRWLSAPAGGARLRILITQFKPVSRELWQRVERSHINLLDAAGLAAARARSPVAAYERG